MTAASVWFAAMIRAPTSLPEPTQTAKPAQLQRVYTMAVKREWDFKEGMNQPFWGQTQHKCSEGTSIRFQNTLKNAPANAWDASKAGDGTVKAWMQNGELTVGTDGVIAVKSSWN